MFCFNMMCSFAGIRCFEQPLSGHDISQFACRNPINTLSSLHTKYELLGSVKISLYKHIFYERPNFPKVLLFSFCDASLVKFMRPTIVLISVVSFRL